MCKSKATCIMYTVNILLLLFGIALAAVAGAVKTNRQDMVDNMGAGVTAEDINEIMPPSSVNIGLAGGIMLIAVGILGIVGTKFYEHACGKILLILYSLFLFIVMALEFVAMGVAFSLSGKLADFDNAKVDKADAAINKTVNAIYDACCVKANKPAGCGTLKSVTDKACDSFVKFKTEMVAWIDSKLKLVGLFSVVVGIIQFITFCASCCLLFRGKDKKEGE